MTHSKVLGVLAGQHMSVAKIAAWIESADLVIAADAGMLRVLEAGYIPDVVIGDFDSFSQDRVDPGIKVVEDCSQDVTDCAKLLNFVKGEGHSAVTLICAEGDLTDHFLDTVHSSVRADLSVTIGLERGQAHILKGPIEKCFSSAPGIRVSLLPLEIVRNASLSGVRWSFSGETLSIRGFTSISNIATENELKVSFDSGSAYLFLESGEPEWPALNP